MHWWRWHLDTLIRTKQWLISNINKKEDRQKGGGIALVTWRKYRITMKPETTNYSSFEHAIWNIQIGPRVYTIIGLYHPHKEQTQISNANFLDQLTNLLSHVIPKHQDIIIMGDFNIHINDSEDQDAQTLQDTLTAFNLKQHINIPTHNLGHTIDLIITSNNYMGQLIPGSYISDHRMITLNTNIPKPNPKTEIKVFATLQTTKYSNLLTNSTIYQY